MGLKGKRISRKMISRKKSLRKKSLRKAASRHHIRKNRTHKRHSIHKRQGCMRGGNYEKDITTRTTEGVPTKPLNKFVVTVPGYGTMSGSAYIRLMEDIDRNGKDIYD